jgi:hypothetical protein
MHKARARFVGIITTKGSKCAFHFETKTPFLNQHLIINNLTNIYS